MAWVGGWQRGMQPPKGHQRTEQEQPLPEQVATVPGQEHRGGRTWDQLPGRCNCTSPGGSGPLPERQCRSTRPWEQNTTTELFTPPGKQGKASQVWWLTTFNPALTGWIPGRSRLHSKFQASRGNRVRPCLKGGGLEKTPSVYQWTNGSSQHAHPYCEVLFTLQKNNY